MFEDVLGVTRILVAYCKPDGIEKITMLNRSQPHAVEENSVRCCSTAMKIESKEDSSRRSREGNRSKNGNVKSKTSEIYQYSEPVRIIISV